MRQIAKAVDHIVKLVPVKNILTDAGQGVITLCSGVLMAEEFIDAIRQRYVPEECIRKFCYVLTDHTAVERFEMSTDDIITVGEISLAAAKVNPNIFLAAVTPSDLAFGLVRIWQSYADRLPWQTQLFRDRASAEEWLRTHIDMSLTFR